MTWKSPLGAVRAMAQGLLTRFGYSVFRTKDGYHYISDVYGHSAQKLPDVTTSPDFGALAGQVIKEGRVCLYYDRLSTIYNALANLARTVNPAEQATLIEVGVYKGGTSKFMASAAKKLGLPRPMLYCFDTFTGHAAEDIHQGVETTHRPSGFSDTDVESVAAYLKEFPNAKIVKGRFQDTCHSLDQVKINFAHIDVDIYEPIKFCLNFLDDKLAIGGLMVVDDYGFLTCPGSERAVAEFLADRNNYIALPMLTGQVVLCKTNESPRG